jgi:hypothetical protein
MPIRLRPFILTVFLTLFLPIAGFGQIGGSSTYKFLSLPASARVSALGGSLMSVVDDDVNQMVLNPAALNPEMHNRISFNTALYIADVNFGYFGYARNYEKIKTTFGVGMQYISYGKFDRTDESGMITGSFKAGEYAFNISAARAYKQFNYGMTLKFIYSSLEAYSSMGMAIDLGGTYVDSAGRFMAAVTFNNMGTQLSSYVPGNNEPLPMNIQVGIARQFAHLPFRFSIIFNNLQKWNIRYDDPNNKQNDDIFGDTTNTAEKSYWLDNLARHMIIGGEFLIGKGFRLRVGYNHLRRQELKMVDRSAMVGFSFGVGIKIYRFMVDYSLAGYHLGGASNQFSISTNLQEFIPGMK